MSNNRQKAPEADATPKGWWRNLELKKKPSVAVSLGAVLLASLVGTLAANSDKDPGLSAVTAISEAPEGASGLSTKLAIGLCPITPKGPAAPCSRTYLVNVGANNSNGLTTDTTRGKEIGSLVFIFGGIPVVGRKKTSQERKSAE